MKDMMKKASCLVLALHLSACGSQLPDSEKKSATASPSFDSSSDATSSSGRCKLSAIPEELKIKGFSSTDINKLTLKTPDGQSRSLCDYLQDLSNETMMIQFSGVTCLSCIDEAKYFSNALQLRSPFGNKIAHLVAFTDLPEDYEDADYKKFMDTYAPQSIRAHDDEIKLWKFFSKDPAAPTRPTMLVINNRGWTFLVNEEGRTAEELYAAAEVLSAQKSSDILVDQESADIDANSSGGNVGSNQKPPPSPPPPAVPGTPPPGNTPPSGKPISLTAAQNFSIVNASGATETLSQYFEQNDYVLIDLSQFNCVYCKQLATKHNQSADFQKKMSSGKCKSITLVPTADLTNWIKSYALSTFVGKFSRSTASLSNVAKAFKVAFSGTPTVFMTDRKGNVVTSAVGAEPANLNTFCAN